MSQIQVQGAKELRRALNKAADKDSKMALKKANLEGAEAVAQEARTLVPRGKTLKLSESVRATAGVASGAVRAGRAAVPYSGVIHFGWPARGIEPRPFLYEAADARVDEVAGIYEQRVQEILDAIEASTRGAGGR
jgi:hypothetical protein